MRSSPVLLNGKFECFVVICPYRLKNETESFLSNLNKAAQGMRFCIPRPVIFETRSDSPGDMLEAVENVLARQRPGSLDLIFLLRKIKYKLALNLFFSLRFNFIYIHIRSC